MRAFYRNWEPAGYWRPRRVEQAIAAGRGQVLTIRDAVRAGAEILEADLAAGAVGLATLSRTHGTIEMAVHRVLDEPVLWLAHEAEDADIRARGAVAAERRGRLRDDVAFSLPEHSLADMSDVACFARSGADVDVAVQTRALAASVRALRRDDVRQLAHESAGGGRIEDLGSRRGRGGALKSTATGQAYAAAARQ